MKKIKEFCLVCYTALFFKKRVQHLIEIIFSIRLCRCRSWGNSGCLDVVFDCVELSCRINQGWYGCGWKKVCYRGLLRALVPRIGIQGAGDGVLIVDVVGPFGELFADVLEGLGQRSGNSLQR